MGTVAHRTTTIFIVALLTAGVAGLVGCSNSSGPSGSGYLEPTSPENVLLNLERAYGERDLDEYLACLSEDFKFHFSEEDQQGWPQLPPWFYKSDEQQVHENMFGDEWNVESITLYLSPTSVETIPGGDSGTRTGDTVVVLVETDLRVNKLGGVCWLCSSPQEFRFREVEGSRESGGRALWEMFEWHEFEYDDAGGRVEDAGWGGIKYTFLEFLSEASRRTSPAEVIDQLEAAYVAMDAVNYLDCLSEDFQFFPCEDDVNNPDLDIPPVWWRPEERAIHENMFDESSNVTSISLTLTTTEIVHDTGVDPEDPLDDTYVHTEDVYLLMYLYGGDGFLADDPSEFHLRVDPDEEGPYGETMWEIYEWYDLAGEGWGDVSGRRESTTWGAIKAMFK
jgi:hypothetical protein